MLRGEADLMQTGGRLMCLALGLLFLHRQGAVDATLEVGGTAVCPAPRTSSSRQRARHTAPPRQPRPRRRAVPCPPPILPCPSLVLPMLPTLPLTYPT